MNNICATSIRGGNKRYLLFVVNDYESYGGMNDCMMSFNSIEELISLLETYKLSDRYQIFDKSNCNILSFIFDAYDTDIKGLAEELFGKLT